MQLKMDLKKCNFTKNGVSLFGVVRLLHIFEMNHFLQEEQYSEFVEWGKTHGVTFRRDEVKRNDKPDCMRHWKLLFALFLSECDLS